MGMVIALLRFYSFRKRESTSKCWGSGQDRVGGIRVIFPKIYLLFVQKNAFEILTTVESFCI